MKGLLLAIISICSVITTGYAQGQVNFATKVGSAGMDLRFRDPSGMLMTSPPYVAALQIRQTGGEFRLVPDSATTFRAGPLAGSVSPRVVTFPGIQISNPATLRVVAFNGSSEGDFDSATFLCFSNPVEVRLGGGTQPPPDLIGLNSYFCIPEPSALTIAFLGAAALALGLLKKKIPRHR
jgi:hypothetical protein